MGSRGALIAVPMLMALKIFCDHIESMRPIAEFVSAKPIVNEPANDTANDTA